MAPSISTSEEKRDLTSSALSRASQEGRHYPILGGGGVEGQHAALDISGLQK
jgi:hypothetical protein